MSVPRAPGAGGASRPRPADRPVPIRSPRASLGPGAISINGFLHTGSTPEDWLPKGMLNFALEKGMLANDLTVMTAGANPLKNLLPPWVQIGGLDPMLARLALLETRERIRAEMREPYRTLLGHFRHEIGHYYWDLLVAPTPWIDTFRALFGHERADYAAALRNHYDNGPPPDWSIRFVTSYASAHPWEDWAETWAHYLHMADTADTAISFGVDARNVAVERAKGLVRHDRRVLVAPPRRHRARREMDPGVIGEQRDLPVEHRHVHVLPASGAGAGVERHQHPDERVEPRHHVGKRGGWQHRSAVGKTGLCGVSRHALHQRAEAWFLRVGPGLAPT